MLILKKKLFTKILAFFLVCFCFLVLLHQKMESCYTVVTWEHLFSFSSSLLEWLQNIKVWTSFWVVNKYKKHLICFGQFSNLMVVNTVDVIASMFIIGGYKWKKTSIAFHYFGISGKKEDINKYICIYRDHKISYLWVFLKKILTLKYCLILYCLWHL